MLASPPLPLPTRTPFLSHTNANYNERAKRLHKKKAKQFLLPFARQMFFKPLCRARATTAVSAAGSSAYCLPIYPPFFPPFFPLPAPASSPPPAAIFVAYCVSNCDERVGNNKTILRHCKWYLNKILNTTETTHTHTHTSHKLAM